MVNCFIFLQFPFPVYQIRLYAYIHAVYIICSGMLERIEVIKKEKKEKEKKTNTGLYR